MARKSDDTGTEGTEGTEGGFDADYAANQQATIDGQIEVHEEQIALLRERRERYDNVKPAEPADDAA